MNLFFVLRFGFLYICKNNDNNILKMKTLKALFLLALLVPISGCNRNTETEIYQSSRDNMLDVKHLIHEIDLGDVMVGQFAGTIIGGDYMFVFDYHAMDDAINIFDRNTYKHLVSFGETGQGPKEITRIGEPLFNRETHELYVPDFGKYVILAYNTDSVLVDKKYPPYVKFKFKSDIFGSEYYFVNDTLSYCRAIRPIGTNDFAAMVGKYNMKTGEMKTLEYLHPDVRKKRIMLAVSFADGIYAECNYFDDLISIFDLEGNLKKNIYGPHWGTNDNTYTFVHPVFTNNYLASAYNGEDYDEHKPTKMCMIFTKSGDYVATLNIGYNIISMCYDDRNDRLIFNFNDEIQFGYLDIRDLNL